jgi:hypothetical protein
MNFALPSYRRSLVACSALAAAAGGACAAPSNDACANAIAITVPSAGSATYDGTTVDATNDGTASCASSATSPDVWYTYTHPANAATRSLYLTLAGGQTNFDTAMSVLASCGGTELACDDDSGGNSTSAISLTVQPGST